MTLHRIFLILIAITLAGTACQSTTPLPALNTNTNEVFTLVTGQSGYIAQADMEITLLQITDDARCPAQIECAASGPVTFIVSVTQGANPPQEYTMQTFTDNAGKSPDMQFQGINDRLILDPYQLRVTSILPYPQTLSERSKIKDYQVSFIVTAEK